MTIGIDLGGTNIAVGLARLGKKCGFFARVSDDQLGTFVTDYFDNEGIDTSHIKRCQNGEKIGLTFTEILSETESSILMYRNEAADLKLSVEDIDEDYIKKFRVILEAIRNGTQIKFEMTNRFGKPMFVRCHPKRIEYSEKDDKFRVVTAGWHAVSTVNIAKMRSCVHYTGPKTLEGEEREVQYDTMTLKVLDERNALERVMLHFAHFEKQAEKLDKKHYLVKIKYALADETEMVIRILSFGPLVEVIGSENFRNLVIERLKKQKNCGLF